MKVFCAAFMCVHFGFVIFWQKDLGAKAAHKMLAKLTPAWLIFSKKKFNGEKCFIQLSKDGLDHDGVGGEERVAGKTSEPRTRGRRPSCLVLAEVKLCL